MASMLFELVHGPGGFFGTDSGSVLLSSGSDAFFCATPGTFLIECCVVCSCVVTRRVLLGRSVVCCCVVAATVLIDASAVVPRGG